VSAIRWNGRTDGGTTWHALASIDALIVPSRWYENSPNVILEAFAAGVAVIATDLGGMAELVEPGVNGRLFSLNDVNGLHGLLKGLITDRALLRAFRGRGGAVRSVDDEADELVCAYRGLLNGAHPVPA
jgi:glycosyltransferase involved in cell wall biosynthesis